MEPFLKVLFCDYPRISQRTIHLKKYLDKYCIRVTSSADETLCKHGWWLNAGNIAFKYNGELVENLQRGFKEYVYCMDMDDVDIAK